MLEFGAPLPVFGEHIAIPMPISGIQPRKELGFEGIVRLKSEMNLKKKNYIEVQSPV